MAMKDASTVEEMLPPAQALYRYGLFRQAQAMAERHLLRESGPQELWRLAYPLAFWKEVEAAAEEFGIDPLLILAVMRQESRYNPKAVSTAKAQGLMQVIPPTRDWIAQQLGIIVGSDDMLVPQINIRFGAWYLRWMLNYFKGRPELALAGYNGGPGNAERWWDLPYVQDTDDFLRWIDFDETREYVQLVLMNYEIYKTLDSFKP